MREAVARVVGVRFEESDYPAYWRQRETAHQQLERESYFEPSIDDQIAHCPSEVATEAIKTIERLARL